MRLLQKTPCRLRRISYGAIARNLSIVLAMSAAPVVGLAKDKPIPTFAEVQKVVIRYFNADPDYKPGDLITREDVEPLLLQLQKLGLPLTDADKILARVHSKDDFLSQQLSTPNGRSFMRRIAALPDGYDRVDRLSRLPHGPETVRALVIGPDGDRMIDYMTKTKGGQELGRMLSNAPKGADFNAATNRIYTASQLLNRLQQSHAAARKAADSGRNLH
jgi:hypothetical protein